MPPDRLLWLVPPASAAAAFCVYLATLAPSVGFVDSGELAAVAHTFGVAHPTGYPLFTLLAGVWARLWPGHGIYGLNVFAASCSAAAVGVVADLLLVLLGRAATGSRSGAPSEAAARGLAAAGGALGVGLSRTFWANALSIEVYSLHALLVALVLDAFVRALAPGGPAEARGLRLPAFLLGLAFSNHLTSVELLPGLALAFLLARGLGRAARRELLAAVPCFGLGLLPYVYLPLRAAADPVLNWGDPRTLDRLLGHVLAAEYRGRFLLGGGAFLAYLRYFTRGLPEQLGYVPLALAVLGAVAAWRRSRWALALLAALLAGSVAVACSYSIVDIDSYFLLAYLSLGLLAGFGLHALAGGAGARRGLLALGAGACVAFPLATSLAAVSERGNHLAEDYVRNVLRSLRPNALLLTYQWDLLVGPALYYQVVERAREDALIVDKRLLQRAWYVEQLARRHPELFAPASAEVASLLALARGPRPGGGPSGELAARVEALAARLAHAHVDARPVYVTVEIEASFAPGLKQVPEGLVLRLYRPERMPLLSEPVWDDFEHRPFPRRDRLSDQVRGVYAEMLAGRGALLEENGRPGEARRYYERALAFEPAGAVREAVLARLEAARAPRP